MPHSCQRKGPAVSDANIGDSDFDKTMDEQAKSKEPEKRKEGTTEPAKSPSTGLPLPEFLLNRQIGSGKVVGALGSGGMGDVYKVWNEDLGLHRAVKIIQRSNDPRSAKRFEREIKISAQFDHPNIIRIHGTGLWKGYRFLEMEYISGASLDSVLKDKKKLPQQVAVAVGILASRGLECAHRHTYTLEGKVCRGVVHRDIKPGNIMLSSEGRLKVMDFGIARPVTEGIATLTMGIVGSWPYLPPEQLDGCMVDRRADIYALGTVLYELLTGTVAFPFNNQKEFYQNKTRGKYKPIQEFSPHTSEDLLKTVDKCLKVNPEARYQTAADLELALTSLLHKSTPASPERILELFMSGEELPTRGGTGDKPGNPSRVFAAISGAVGNKNLRKLLVVTTITIAFAGLFLLLPNHGIPRFKRQSHAPSIVFPEDSAEVNPRNATVLWTSSHNAKSYALLIASTSSFEDTVFFFTDIEDTVFTLPELYDGKPFCLKVAAGTPDGMVHSDARTFVTASLQPAVPIPVAPEHSSTELPTRTTLRWKSENDSFKYRVRVGTTPDFSTVFLDSAGIGRPEFQLSSLSHGKSYYWQVSSMDGELSGEWSDTRIFTTKEKKKEIPAPEPRLDWGQKAAQYLSARKTDEARVAASKLNPGTGLRDSFMIEIAEQYLMSGRVQPAMELLTPLRNRDMYAAVLIGRIFLNEGRCTSAESVLKTAETVDTRFDRNSLEADVGYYKARAYHCLWEKDKGRYRGEALTAWQNVWRLYRNDRSHPRYIEAADASNRIAGE